MPSTQAVGRKARHKVGYIAVGYSKEDDFWYSSEGVFSLPKYAIEDLEGLYPVDFSYSVKIDLWYPNANSPSS